MKHKIKIAIADDHPVVLEGISNLLGKRDHFEIIATYITGQSLLKGLEQQQPDVLLLDIQFPDTTGNELVRIIIPKYPKIMILVLSGIDNIFDIKDMMQQGCKGYILKNVSVDILIEAIETVDKGNEFLEPDLKERLYQSLLKPGFKKEETYKLTKRESNILELISNGHTNHQIAEMLFLSYRTIQNNRSSLYHKMEVSNSAELIKKAIQMGLIE